MVLQKDNWEWHQLSTRFANAVWDGLSMCNIDHIAVERDLIKSSIMYKTGQRKVEEAIQNDMDYYDSSFDMVFDHVQWQPLFPPHSFLFWYLC